MKFHLRLNEHTGPVNLWGDNFITIGVDRASHNSLPSRACRRLAAKSPEQSLGSFRDRLSGILGKTSKMRGQPRFQFCIVVSPLGQGLHGVIEHNPIT